MLKNYSVLMLIGLVINLTFGSFVFAQDTDARAAEKIKIQIAKFGTKGRLTEVKRKDKTKIKGYITEIKENEFVLVSKKNGASTTVSYTEVKDIRRTFTTFQQVAIGFGLAFAAIGIIGVVCVANGKCEE